MPFLLGVSDGCQTVIIFVLLVVWRETSNKTWNKDSLKCIILILTYVFIVFFRYLYKFD